MQKFNPGLRIQNVRSVFEADRRNGFSGGIHAMQMHMIIFAYTERCARHELCGHTRPYIRVTHRIPQLYAQIV